MRLVPCSERESESRNHRNAEQFVERQEAHINAARQMASATAGLTTGHLAHNAASERLPSLVGPMGEIA